MSGWRLRRRALAEPAGDWPTHVHPVLRRIYVARGVRDPADIEHRLARLVPPTALGGLAAATQLLAAAIANDRRILIAGDYDCDGATGVAVGVRGLRLLGARHVAYVVPNRFEHGYGLSAALVASLAETPDLLVTVDNGIASLDGVAAARARGIQVIVTDHHLPGTTLPAADAIVNPNLPGDGFPSKALAGVGVMFYLLLALRAQMYSGERPDLSSLLDLVALGTVADLVPLDYNNRILVEAGLRRMRAGRGCAGITALAEAGGRSTATLVASDMAFALAPRLNAAGRLQDMTRGSECLGGDDPARARELAAQLSAINVERRELQATMVAEAEAIMADTRVPDAVGVTLCDARWHAGVVGLVASKLKERLHRPVVAFAPAGAGSDQLRGSARSIAGFHIRDALAAVDARHPGLLGPFGGHAMAAGLSLAAVDLARFAQAFDAIAREWLGAEALDAVLWTDGELEAGAGNLDLAQQLRYAGPWGQAFPVPVFDNLFECVQRHPMGVGHLRLRLRDPRDGALFEAVMFNTAETWPATAMIRAAYELTVNDWQGRESARLLLRHAEPA
jgi:single-stranded-DNA-specific exonuclease